MKKKELKFQIKWWKTFFNYFSSPIVFPTLSSMYHSQYIELYTFQFSQHFIRQETKSDRWKDFPIGNGEILLVHFTLDKTKFPTVQMTTVNFSICYSLALNFTPTRAVTVQHFWRMVTERFVRLYYVNLIFIIFPMNQHSNDCCHHTAQQERERLREQEQASISSPSC